MSKGFEANSPVSLLPPVSLSSSCLDISHKVAFHLKCNHGRVGGWEEARKVHRHIWRRHVVSFPIGLHCWWEGVRQNEKRQIILSAKLDLARTSAKSKLQSCPPSPSLHPSLSQTYRFLHGPAPRHAPDQCWQDCH